MAGRDPDFVLLVDSPDLGLPQALRGIAPLFQPFRPARWGEVEFRPPGDDRATTGTIILAGPSDSGIAARCEARARRARQRGSALIVLGGALAGREALAKRLFAATGLPVLAGVALETAAMIEACLVLLRWRGIDPGRAGAIVLVDPEHPTLGEAVVEYLSGLIGSVAVWGLERLRRRVLEKRVLESTGAALETPKSLRHGLETADLVVSASRHRDSGAFPRFPVSGAGPSELHRPIVTAALPPLGWARRDGEAETPVLLRLSGLSAALPAGDYPLRVLRVYFARPPGWCGRGEPGLPGGTLSAQLAEAVIMTRLGRRRVLRRHLSGEVLARMREAALELGFRPHALAAIAGRMDRDRAAAAARGGELS